MKHASGQNYIIGGPERAYSFECSSHKVSRFIPEEAADLVWHTNHALANDDYSPGYREYIKNQKNGSKGPTNSEIRLECVRHRALEQPSNLDVDVIKSILKSQDPVEHPVSGPLMDKNSAYTFGSVIMVLSEKPELHVAPGRRMSCLIRSFSLHVYRGTPLIRGTACKSQALCGSTCCSRPDHPTRTVRQQRRQPVHRRLLPRGAHAVGTIAGKGLSRRVRRRGPRGHVPRCP